MRFFNTPRDAAVLSVFLLPLLTQAQGIDCTHVKVNGVSYNLSKLGGPRSVMESVVHGDGGSFTNTTYTIDICAPLRRVKDVKKEEKCPEGTRVCAIERSIKDSVDFIQDAFPLAGELRDHGGKAMDPKWSLLKESASHEDSKKDGLSLEIKGGFNKINNKVKDQKAIVEFICDPKLEGLENLHKSEDEYATTAARKREEEKKDEDKKEGEGDKKDGEGDKKEGEGDKKDGEGDKKDEDKKDGESCMSSLQFVRYDQSDAETDVLRLSWRTKYACEGAKDDQDKVSTAHWGFFTWFILIAFLGTAAYLIFGSWLNYNRYGARGWDLVPHGDAIRDVPYMMKDWTRKVVSSVQGGGSRGGYAAV